jgi:hydroxymethylpyrimidine pyrophosphatase-like HAD family hydrolase
MKYPPARVIAVDVDGTLLFQNGKPNFRIVEFCKRKKSEGFTLFLWSSRGESHALEALKKCNLEGVFEHVLSKPGYIVDDKGWTWTRFVARIMPR